MKIAILGYDVEGKGKIHLSFAYVNSHMPNREEQVARTIIHEASHKFAGTTDVLYKSQSFSKMGLFDEDLANLQWQQPGGTRAAGAYVGKAKQEKPLRLLAGADNSGHQIDSVRFLENADSYAWTARRLWKRFRKFRY